MALAIVVAVGGPASSALSSGDGRQASGDLLAKGVAASAYAVIDLRTQAVLDEQRSDWLDAPVSPGSIAKLATFTAAIDAGTLTDHTHIVCTRRVTLRDGRRVDCSHPPVAAALSLREAVALSCNVFAAEVARRLTASQLAAGFTRVGLPAPPADRDHIAVALGLDGVQVPPRRLLQALVRVIRTDADDPGERADAHAAARALLREGLRESARAGTASAFGRAGIDAFAKTGTALMRNGRSLGLVVALAPAPSPRLGIVVALPGGAGADAADVAATLLRQRLTGAAVARRAPAALDIAAAAAAATSIRVGTPIPTGGYRVESVPLEDYVARVVAGETSSATPQAAREALAITARTYALANRGRHAADGFDLCTLTHCQVLRPASPASRDAAARTRGRILTRDRDAVGAPVPVFYSAACGGLLDDASTLLPDARPGSIAWMTSRPDPAGVDEPRWHADLAIDDVMRALHAAGVRGETLRDLSVETNATGRVTAVSLAGLTPSALDADHFRRIMGQRLGWQWLESLRFTVQRTARGYRFEGRGHGHGVGLCVFGASALATRGRTTDEILEAYFPGLRTVIVSDAPPAPTGGSASAPAHASAPAATIDVRLPASEERERAYLRSRVARDLRELSAALNVSAAAPAPSVPPQRVSLIVYPTGDSYRRATGRPWWTSAATTFDAQGNATIHLVPLAGLRRTGRLDTTIRHEMAHVLTAPQLRARPLWAQEGVAAYFAGERTLGAGAQSAAQAAAREDTRANAPADLEESCPSDAEFTRAGTSDAFQRAYARAAACVARELARGASWTSIGKADR